MKLTGIQNELDSLKAEILELKQRKVVGSKMRVGPVTKANDPWLKKLEEYGEIITKYGKKQVFLDLQDFKIDEVRERVRLDSDSIAKKLRLAEEDLVLAKQMLATVTTQRSDIAREFFECDRLNVTRKLAVKSL